MSVQVTEPGAHSKARGPAALSLVSAAFLSGGASVTPGLQAIHKPRPVKILPGMALTRARVHEVMGPAADSFVLHVLSKTTGRIIWTGRDRRIASLCPLGMQAYFDPGRLITCGCISRKEVLWSTEQALRSRGADVIVAELDQGPNLKESRRLQLAAEAGRTLGLILIGRGAQSSAAQTRWMCTPHIEGTGWHWQLVKHKSGQLGNWDVARQSLSSDQGLDHA